MAEVKTDCFAFDPTLKNRPCKALTDLYCANENCKFYKSKEQYLKEIRGEKR